MSATAYRLGVTDDERAEIDTCTECPLPECVDKSVMYCPVFDLHLGLNEMLRKWQREVVAAEAELRRRVAA